MSLHIIIPEDDIENCEKPTLNENKTNEKCSRQTDMSLVFKFMALLIGLIMPEDHAIDATRYRLACSKAERNASVVTTDCPVSPSPVCSQ